MSKRIKTHSTTTDLPRGGWARYPQRLPSTRVSDGTRAALRTTCERLGVRESDYLRNALEVALAADGAQSATHSGAQSGSHATAVSQT
jgi:hypothetical protein